MSKVQLRIVCALITAGAIATASTAVSAADFFAGKTITLVVGAAPGGGFDLYARLFARYLQRHLSGSPTVIVRNQPGAGSGVAASSLYFAAPKDGTTIGAIFPGVIVGSLLDARPTKYDPAKFTYLGSIFGGARVCFSYATAKVATFAQAQKTKATMGATAAGGSTRDYAYLAKEIAGAKFEVVAGYKGPAEMFLAMERGELDGICGLDWASLKLLKPDWLKDKKVNLLVQFGSRPDAELTALGVPDIWKFVGKADDKAAAELIFGQQTFGRPYVAPPGVPAEQTKLLRNAFAAVMSDPDFLSEAKSNRLAVNPTMGEATQALVKKLYSTPESIAKHARELIAPK
jgi:tripartite-type tricarboxylate transporter receptor subunit TctC